MSGAAPLGLYSISVRGLDVPELLTWAVGAGIPFIHLRGGPRGYDLGTREEATLARWHAVSRSTVPITGVTADTDLADLFSGDPAVRCPAQEDVRRLADAARVLGARWVRLLARRPLTAAAADGGALRGLGIGVPLLVELHDPGWLAAQAHRALLRLLDGAQPRLRLLADSAQLAHALTSDERNEQVGERLEQLWPWADVLHLSDAGPGLASPGHAAVADAAVRRIAGGQRIEAAVEWTGADRTPAAALDVYRRHSAWWTARHSPIAEAAS